MDTWTDEAIERIERYVTYDLNCDGYRVRMERLSGKGRTRGLCSRPFQWKLRIVNTMA